MSETWIQPPGVLASMLHERGAGLADVAFVELAPGAVLACKPHRFVERIVVVVGLVYVVIAGEDGVELEPVLLSTARRAIEIPAGRAHRIESAYRQRTASFLSVMSGHPEST